MTNEDLKQHAAAFRHASLKLMEQGERPDAPHEVTVVLGGLAVAAAAIAAGYISALKEVK
jgi:hypothetical protein